MVFLFDINNPVAWNHSCITILTNYQYMCSHKLHEILLVGWQNVALCCSNSWLFSIIHLMCLYWIVAVSEDCAFVPSLPCNPKIQEQHQLRIGTIKLIIAGLIKKTQVANNGELTKGINSFKILEYNVLVPTTFTSSKRFLIWKHLLAFKAFLLSYGSPSKVHIQLTVVSFNVTCPSHSSDSNVIKATSKMVSKMRLHF